MRKNYHFGNDGSGYPGHINSHISATERGFHLKFGTNVVFMKSSANSKKVFPNIWPIFSSQNFVSEIRQLKNGKVTTTTTRK